MTAAPYASVRFFRVGTWRASRPPLLLAQTLTDQNGAYSTSLPTR